MRLRHVPAPASRRGPITHAWIRIVRRYGSVSFHVMPIEDIEAIRRQYSRQWSPDKVKDCPPWYAIKTCIRDYLARQPKMSERLQDALNDEEAEKEEVDDAVS
jgi:recombinational DNA repair protein RecT